MTNVISLGQVRIQKMADEAGLCARAPVVLDYSDVARYSAETGPADSDPIILGSAAAMQVRRMFWGYGLNTMPETWAELVANHSYCQTLHLFLMRFGSAEPADMEMDAFKRHEAEVPGRGTLLRNLAVGNFEAAHAWHKAQGTFQANTKVPMFLRKKG